MQLIAKAQILNDEKAHVFCLCLNQEGNLNDGAFSTLATFVELIAWDDAVEQEVRELVTKAEQGLYVSPNKKLPDFGINDVNLWLDEPLSPKGKITITNENTNFDSGSENLQRFTYPQFWTALAFMHRVRDFEKKHGASALLHQSLVCVLPNAT